MEDMIKVMGNGFAGGIAPSQGPNIKGGSSTGSFSTSFAHTLRASECRGADKDGATTPGNSVGGNKDPLRRHDFPPGSYGRSVPAPVGEEVHRLIHDEALDFLPFQPGKSAHEISDDVLVDVMHGPGALISVDGVVHVLTLDESEVGTMVQQAGASALGKIDRQSSDFFGYRETWSSWEHYRSSGVVSGRSGDHRSVSFGIANRLLGEAGNQGITPQQMTNTSARPAPPADSVKAPLPYDPVVLEQKQGTALDEGMEPDATFSQRVGLISKDPSLLTNRVGVNHIESSQAGTLFPDIKVSEQKSIGASSTQVLGSEVRLRDPESFSTDLSTHLRVLKAQGGGEARLQLNPAEMGRMLVTVTTQGEDTRVAFVVESAQVKQVIEASLPRLRDLLEQSGMQLIDSDVRDRTSDHSNRGSGSEYQTEESETDDASHADVIAVNTDKRHLLDAYA